MSTADDGTQERTVENIERAMALKGISNGEMARYLGLGESQWGNVKGGRQVLAPWMLRKISKRLGSAVAVTAEFVAVTGESVARDVADPAVDVLGCSVSLVSEAADVPRAILDGTRTREGRERALRELDEVQAKIDALRAALTVAA